MIYDTYLSPPPFDSPSSRKIIPMRTAFYGRFSTDRQRETSIADQERTCAARAASLNTCIQVRHSDEGVSGSTPVALRAGGKALLADALAGRLDVLLVEGLDRLSRDMVEQETVIRRMEHRGIRIIGVADGYDSASKTRKLHRGMRGIINEVYLDDLREKTHRGLAGQVSRGMHAGGLSYGYRTVAVEGGHQLAINEEQAEWVRWIFMHYAQGWSCQRIAHELNRLGVPSPRGGTWAVSAIYGNPARLAGLVNNELYVGRYVWNRSQWVKDPDTGRRTRVDRPRDEWSVSDMPHLRIISNDMWAAARTRMARRETKQQGGKKSTLFGGILRCAHCGGPVVAVSKYQYGCATKKDRGTCPGVLTPRNSTDARLIEIIRDDLLSPEALIDMQRQAHEIAKTQRKEARSLVQQSGQRIIELEAEIGRLTDALARIGYSDAIGARLRMTEAELARLHAQPSDPPQEAELQAALENYRRMLENLDSALEDDTEVAREILRELLGAPIVGQNEAGAPWVEIAATPLACAAGNVDAFGCGGRI